MKNEITLLFEELPIRKVKIDGEWWVSAIDTARAIGYSNPARDFKQIITRNIERFEGYTTRFKLTSNQNGVDIKRMTTCLNLKGVIAFCMLSQLPNAIPFQRWADKVLEKHIKDKVKRKQIYGDEDIRKGDMDGEQLLKLMISNATNALSLMNKTDPVGMNGIETQLYKTVKMIDGISK